MNIFFDLDGTLIDAKARMYGLFQQLVPGSSMTFEEYWALKRNKIGHSEILSGMFGYPEVAIEDFQREWMNNIELPEWLAKDQPFEGVSFFLEEISKAHSLFIVTARQSRAGVLDQLEQFGWSGLFEEVFVTEQKKQKDELLREVKISEGDWLIGDTGKDIETGKQLGMNTAAVLSGFLGEEKLSEYKPDLIMQGVVDFKNVVSKNE